MAFSLRQLIFGAVTGGPSSASTPPEEGAAARIQEAGPEETRSSRPPSWRTKDPHPERLPPPIIHHLTTTTSTEPPFGKNKRKQHPADDNDHHNGEQDDVDDEDVVPRKKKTSPVITQPNRTAERSRSSPKLERGPDPEEQDEDEDDVSEPDETQTPVPDHDGTLVGTTPDVPVQLWSSTNTDDDNARAAQERQALTQQRLQSLLVLSPEPVLSSWLPESEKAAAPSPTLHQAEQEEDEEEAQDHAATSPRRLSRGARRPLPQVVLTEQVPQDRTVPPYSKKMVRFGRLGRPPRDPAQQVLATEPQQQVHKRKLQIWSEWNQIRRQWKNRQVQIQPEQDVGHALEYRIRAHQQRDQQLLLFSSSSSQPPLPPHAQRPEEPALQEDHDDHDDEVMSSADSSEVEQELVLNQLLRGSQQAEENQRDRRREGGGEQEPPPFDGRSYKERLNYLERGRSFPHRDDLAAIHHQPYRPVLLPGLPPVDPRRPTRAGRGWRQPGIRDPSSSPWLTLATLPGRGYARKESPPFLFFPLSHQRYAPAKFMHYRHILRLAARQIVGNHAASGQEEYDPAWTEEDRWIQWLWHPQIRSSHQSSILLNLANECGRNWNCFLSHSWKDRHSVAQSFGLTPDRHTRGHPDLLGFTLNTERRSAMGHRHRKMMVRQQSLGLKTHWIHGSTNLDEENHDANHPATTSAWEKRGQLLLELEQMPHTTYIAIQGTVPPTPTFPLDETGTLFGPPDRFVHVSHSGPVDGMTFRLTLASLLKRLATATAREEVELLLTSSVSEDKVACSSSQYEERLHKFLQQAMHLNHQRKFYKWLRNRKRPIHEMPLSTYAAVMTECCSLASSGLAIPEPLPTPDEENASNSDSEDEEVPVVEVKPAKERDDDDETEEQVQKFFDFCERHLVHNGLQMFHHLYVTFGILHVARFLPASAIDILSRPLDPLHYRAPCELVRATLEHLEQMGALVEGAVPPSEGFNSPKIHVGVLEYAFHQATQVLARCVERDPIEVLHHQWHLAFLGGSLLLCSGNKIGSAARCYPSFLTQQDDHVFERLQDERERGEDAVSVSHEVRQRLPKFAEIRRETARALELTLYLARHQKSHRSHLAVSSFLEWRPVMALLVGDHTKQDAFQSICDLHRYHALEWAHSEGSEETRSYILHKSSSYDLDSQLDSLARALEQDPSQLERWRALSEKLGPIGVPFSKTTEGQSEPPCTCADCQLLLDGYRMTRGCHHQRRQTAGRGWWGQDRCTWWGQHLLSLQARPNLPKDCNLESLCYSLDQVLRPPSSLKSGPAKREATAAMDAFSRLEPDLEWLTHAVQAPLDLYDREESVPSRSCRQAKVDSHLPRSFGEISEQDDDDGNNRERWEDDDVEEAGNEQSHPDGFEPVSLHEALQTQEGAEPEAQALRIHYELTGYKLVIICHLYGPSHPWIRPNLLALSMVRDIWNDQQQNLASHSPPFVLLRWCHEHLGLYVTRLLRGTTPVAFPPPSRRRRNPVSQEPFDPEADKEENSPPSRRPASVILIDQDDDPTLPVDKVPESDQNPLEMENEEDSGIFRAFL